MSCAIKKPARSALLLGLCLALSGPGTALLAQRPETFDTAANPPPQNLDEQLRAAYAAEAVGELETAAELYRNFFDRGGGGGYAHASYARLLIRQSRFAQAMDHAAAALAQTPEDADHYSLAAQALRLNGRVTEAEQTLLLAATRFPDQAEPVLGMADFYQETNRSLLASAYYAYLLRLSADAGSRGAEYRSIALWRLAENDHKRGRAALARSALAEYVASNPDRLYARSWYADQFAYRQGRFSEAALEIDRLLELPPERLREQNVDLRYLRSLRLRMHYLADRSSFMEEVRELRNGGQLNALEQGLLLERSGQDEQALPLLLAVVRQYEREYAAWVGILRIIERSRRLDLESRQLLHLALIELRLGRSELAWPRIDRLFAIRTVDANQAPPADVLHRLRAMALENDGQNLRSALAWRRSAELAAMRQSMPDQISALLARAEALRRAGFSWATSALQASEQARSLTPDSESAVLQTASLYFWSANGDPAILERGLALLEQSPAVVATKQGALLRARLLYEAGRTDEALAVARQVIAAAPEMSDAQNFAGYLLAEENLELPEARRYLEFALQNEGDDPHILDSLGWLEYREGQLPRARLTLAAAIAVMERRGETSAEAFWHLAKAEEGLGRGAAAEEWKRRARLLLEGTSGPSFRVERRVRRELGL
ncbi:MAG: tetratricopeptide repeat protein [Leptospirales bacterium]|nr:tetratricopeptide repeat protein [Leptospirales bacterium]